MDAKTIAIIAGAVVGTALLATGVTVAVKKGKKEKEDAKDETVETATESTVPEQVVAEQQKQDDKVATPNFTKVDEKKVNTGFVNDTTITNPEATLVAHVQ